MKNLIASTLLVLSATPAFAKVQSLEMTPLFDLEQKAEGNAIVISSANFDLLSPAEQNILYGKTPQLQIVVDKVAHRMKSFDLRYSLVSSANGVMTFEPHLTPVRFNVVDKDAGQSEKKKSRKSIDRDSGKEPGSAAEGKALELDLENGKYLADFWTTTGSLAKKHTNYPVSRDFVGFTSPGFFKIRELYNTPENRSTYETKTFSNHPLKYFMDVNPEEFIGIHTGDVSNDGTESAGCIRLAQHNAYLMNRLVYSVYKQENARVQVLDPIESYEFNAGNERYSIRYNPSYSHAELLKWDNEKSDWIENAQSMHINRRYNKVLFRFSREPVVNWNDASLGGVNVVYRDLIEIGLEIKASENSKAKKKSRADTDSDLKTYSGQMQFKQTVLRRPGSPEYLGDMIRLRDLGKGLFEDSAGTSRFELKNVRVLN